MNDNSFSYSGHVKFPLPSNCGAGWGTLEWERWVKETCVMTEPPEIRSPNLGLWRATGERDAKGDLLYYKVEENADAVRA